MVKFRGFLFDRKQGVLSRDEEFFHLEHQQAKILNFLIDNKDTVVSREQIAEQIWQGVIVEDNTISKAITRLRKVLNDSAKSSSIIKTIPKKGYQFIAELEEVTETPEEHVDVGLSSKISIGYKATAALTVAFLLFILLPEMQKESTPTAVTQPIPVSVPQPISFREGIELNAHLHADKHKLVFIGNEGDGYGIYTKQIGDANAQLLTSVSARSVYPKWLQPEGSSIVYSDIDETGQCQIYRLESIHIPKKEVIATCIQESPVEVFVLNQTGSFVWSDDAGSWQQNISKGSRQSLPYDSRGVRFQMPSPNGLLWAVLKDVGDLSTLVVYEINSKRVVLEHELPYNIAHFRWSEASDALYHLGEHPANQLYQLSLEGKRTLLASTSVGTMTSISDVQSQDSIEFVISVVDLDIHQITQNEETKRINSPFADYNPALSNSSYKLAFASKRTGSAQVWLEDKNALLTQLSQFERASYIYDLAWSPDERQLLVKRNDSIHIINPESKEESVLPIDAKNKVDWQWLSNEKVAYVDQVSNSLFSVELTGNHSALLFANVGNAQYADGQWFVSDTSGESLYLLDTNLADKTLISSQLDNRHWIVIDGQLHVVNRAKDKPMSLVKLVDGEEEVVTSGSFNPYSLATTTSGTLVFHRMSSSETNIYQLRLQ
ncbi:winged helix-turn-helix domain-containing protein [Thalassotalea euphylliae]|uniref:winged helix-turn-helix domain-containing protein n=1 Tax=Thalassotalea euphylliae TaxID=1655234 RepID=UPI0036319E23